MIIRNADYQKYVKFNERIPANRRRDTYSKGEVQQMLRLLVGKTVLASDGCYEYEVTASGVRYQGGVLGKSTVDGLLGWVCSIGDLTDLLEELDYCRDIYKHPDSVGMALWTVGLAREVV